MQMVEYFIDILFELSVDISVVHFIILSNLHVKIQRIKWFILQKKLICSRLNLDSSLF